MVKKMKNGVRYRTSYTEGYGGPAAYGAHFFYKNRTLSNESFYSCCNQAVWLYRMRKKYRKLDEQQLLALVKDAPQALPVCDQCKRPLVNGAVYQGGLQRCKKCSDGTPYNQVTSEVTTRAKARESAQRKEIK
jgi:hypothetical protein